MARRSARLGCQLLETRATPAGVGLVNGNLTLSNNLGPIVVTQQPTGDFNITDNAINLGNFKITNNLTINTSNGNDQVTVSLFPGQLLPGSLTINANNGADRLTVSGGRIGNNLTINAGTGNDSIYLGRTFGGGLDALEVSGATAIAGGSGVDLLATGDAIFSSVFVASQLNQIGLATAGGSTTINGNVSVDNTYDFAAANSFNINAAGTIAGNFKYIGGTGNDNIALAGTLQTVAGRATTIDAGEGNSTLSVSGTVGNLVNANLTYKGNSNALVGTDSVSFAATAKVSGNLALFMGNGAAAYDLAHNFTVGGNFTLSAGSENDVVGAIDADIGGSAFVGLGSGNDSILFGTLGLGVASVGAKLSIDVGAGNDFVAVNLSVGAGTGQLAVFLGAGADTFEACDALYTNFGAATINLGIDANNDKASVLLALAPFTLFQNVGGGDVTMTC